MGTETGFFCKWGDYPIHIARLEDTSRVDLLICTLISGNQILEKSRSVSNLRKISGSANPDFFSRLRLYYKSQKNPGDKLKKNPGLQDLKIF